MASSLSNLDITTNGFVRLHHQPVAGINDLVHHIPDAGGQAAGLLSQDLRLSFTRNAGWGLVIAIFIVRHWYTQTQPLPVRAGYFIRLWKVLHKTQSSCDIFHYIIWYRYANFVYEIICETWSWYHRHGKEGIQLTWFTNPIMHQFTSHNASSCDRNVHTRAHLLQNGALWDICLMHCGMFEMGQLLCMIVYQICVSMLIYS